MHTPKLSTLPRSSGTGFLVGVVVVVVMVMPCGESGCGAKREDDEDNQLFHDLILARVIDFLHEIRTRIGSQV